jgi:hypothetical protein
MDQAKSILETIKIYGKMRLKFLGEMYLYYWYAEPDIEASLRQLQTKGEIRQDIDCIIGAVK